MATYIVRMLDRPGEFCGVVREVATGAASPFVDTDELVALLQAYMDRHARDEAQPADQGLGREGGGPLRGELPRC